MKATPIHAVVPEPDRSYLVFCPEHGGWHVAEWWTGDGPGRWVLVVDTGTTMPPISHVMSVPPDPMDDLAMLRWTVLRRATPAGTA
jgi:hypothetical protein